MPVDHHDFGKRIRKRLDELARRYARKRDAWMAPFPVGVRIESQLLIQGKRWRKLQRAAESRRRSTLRDLTALEGFQTDWGRIWKDVQQMRVEGSRSWTAPEEHPEWPKLRAHLLVELPKKGLTPEQVAQGVREFGKATADQFMKAAEMPLELLASEMEVVSTSRLSGLAAADLAEAVAQFNEYCQNTSGGPSPRPRIAQDVQVEITKLLRGLHGELRTGTRSAIMKAAGRLESRAAQRLEPLLRAAAQLAVEQSETSDRYSGRRAIDTADAIRSVLFARSAARLITWRLGWLENSPTVEAWRNAARAKRFASVFKSPPLTNLAEVARDPQRHDGKYISLEGRVGPVTIVHKQGKVISSTSLVGSAGAVVQVGLTHIKIDSGGLVPGTYAQVTGTFSASHDDFTTPVLIPDRRNLGEDSKRSWLDWLALELRLVSTTTAHNLCGHWSWAPGTDGAGNPLRYGTWSASDRRAG